MSLLSNVNLIVNVYNKSNNRQVLFTTTIDTLSVEFSIVTLKFSFYIK